MNQALCIICDEFRESYWAPTQPKESWIFIRYLLNTQKNRIMNTAWLFRHCPLRALIIYVDKYFRFRFNAVEIEGFKNRNETLNLVTSVWVLLFAIPLKRKIKSKPLQITWWGSKSFSGSPNKAIPAPSRDSGPAGSWKSLCSQDIQWGILLREAVSCLLGSPMP